MRRDRLALTLGALLVCVYMVTFGGHFYTGDGIEIARTAESIALRGELALPLIEGERKGGYIGSDGRRYAPYPLGQSLAEVPLIWAAEGLAPMLPLPEHLKERLRHAAIVSSNVFICAALCILIYAFARRLGYGARVAGGLCLILGLGTMLHVYARHDFGDPLASLGLVAACLLVRRFGDSGRTSDLGWAGFWLGWAIFTKFQMVIYCPVVWLYLCFVRRENRALHDGMARRGPGALARDTAWLAGPVILFGIADMAVNFAKFGALASTGYDQETSPWAGWTHLVTGLYGFLLSPGKSLFLYNPVLLLWPLGAVWFHRKHRSESALTLGALGVSLMFFSPLYWWHGDWSWGPRYLLPVIPLMVLGLAPVLDSALSPLPHRWGRISLRQLLAGLLIAAFAVNMLGMTVNFFFYLRTLRAQEVFHDDWNFIPGLSPLSFHAHVIVSNIAEWTTGRPIDYAYRAWSDGRFSEVIIPMEIYSREGKIPDYFFFKPYDTPLEQWTLGLLGVLFVTLTVFCARAAWRQLRAAEGQP